MITVAFNCPVDYVDLERLTKSFLLLRVQALKRLRFSTSVDLVLVAASFGFSFKVMTMNQEEANQHGALLKARLQPMLDAGIESLDFDSDVTVVNTGSHQYDLWVNFILKTKREKA